MIYVRELTDGIDVPHIWFFEGGRFVISAGFIGGSFRKGAPIMPKFREIDKNGKMP